MKPISKVIPSPSEGNQQEEIFERTQRDLQQTRREFDEHVEKCHTGFRLLRTIGAIVILIVLGFGGMLWYGYRSAGGYKSLWNEIPVLHTSAATTGDRLNSIEGKMTDWSNDQTSLTDRMARMEKALGSGLKAARSEAQSAANQMGKRIREEIGQSLQRLDNRVNNVEAAQRESHDQLAAAQAEIGSLRQEIAGMQKQDAERLTDLQQTQSNVNRLNGKVASIDGQLLAHTDSLNALNEQVEREPVNFELSNGKTEEVSPGIYLTITHTDVAHQKADGWMQLSQEGRFIWIRGLAAQQAMPFVTHSDDRDYELVFTGVQKNGVTGFLLQPRSQSVASAN